MKTLNYDCEKMQQYILELQSGDHTHEDEFYRMCMNYIRMIAHQNAYHFSSVYDLEDLVNEVSGKIFQNLQKYDVNKGKIQTWISTITCHQQSDYLDKMQNEKKHITEDTSYVDEDGEEHSFLEQVSRVSDDVEPIVFANELLEFFHREASNLNQNQEEAFRYFFDGYKPAEAAALMDCKVENYSVFKNRALKTLRNRYEKEYEDDFELGD